ncbi:MAG: hypothetical protein V1904_12195 [Bacteroidota bacterium]
MIAVKSSAGEKMYTSDSFFNYSLQVNIPAGHIHIDEPVNDIRNLKVFFKYIFGLLEDKGTFCFYYNHRIDNSEKRIRPAILPLMIIPFNLKGYGIKILSETKIIDKLFASGFEILDVSSDNGLRKYSARKNILLTI